MLKKSILQDPGVFGGMSWTHKNLIKTYVGAYILSFFVSAWNIFLNFTTLLLDFFFTNIFIMFLAHFQILKFWNDF